MHSPDIGAFIKDLRSNARISLRQLAEQANISNPYLSQIERGLRKPSAEVLAQLAAALRVSTPAMYLKAGLLGSDDSQGVLSAIAADHVLTVAQKLSLSQIYETFVRENERTAADETSPHKSGPADAAQAPPSGEPESAAAAAASRGESTTTRAQKPAPPRPEESDAEPPGPVAATKATRKAAVTKPRSHKEKS